MQTVRCDILIAGGGLAGLSLLYRAVKDGLWNDKQIIVIDQSDKDNNDKTWSFWGNGISVFEPVISHQWKQLIFFTNDGQRISLKSGGYTYNSIKSIDFYNYVLKELRSFENISFVKDKILNIQSAQNECILSTPTVIYIAEYLFNSVYQQPVLRKGDQYFLQHFKGWRIQTKSVIPALSEAYLMDFRTNQNQGTTFVYTLPMTSDEVFIEYTLFSKKVLAQQDYDQQLRTYITEVLKIEQYDILEEEFGVIPMTDYAFKRFEGNIVHIGTAGGDTRASTGYTFTNTQKTIDKILDCYRVNGHPFFKQETIGIKQQLYDSTLLNVLDNGDYQGARLFGDLFKGCRADIIFAFLDAETSILQDLYVMKSLKWIPFIKCFSTAVFRRFFKSA